MVQNSNNVFVSSNTMVVGSSGNGMGLIYQPRGNTTTKNNTIVGNTVIATNSTHGFNGCVANCESPPGALQRLQPYARGCNAADMWHNTTFDSNTWYYSTAGSGVTADAQRRFRWLNASLPLNFSEWQAAGNDVHGSVIELRAGIVPTVCFA